MTTKIAITTPTGKSGRYLTERLLDAVKEKQLEIVLLARDPERVRSFTERELDLIGKDKLLAVLQRGEQGVTVGVEECDTPADCLDDEGLVDAAVGLHEGAESARLRHVRERHD